MILVIREVRQRIRERFRPRILEWEHTAIALLWGTIVLYNPSNFDSPAYSAELFSKPGPAVWGWAVILLGIVRVVALGINGYMARPTAIARSIGAVTGILLFSMLSLGLLFSGTTPTGLAPYSVIGAFGLFSLFWAVLDVVVPDRHDQP